jgi:hypothetical protein
MITRTHATLAPLAVFGCLALFCTGCGPSVRGSGVVATEPRHLSDFNEVWLSGSGDVRIEQTGSESVIVRAEDNLLPLLQTRVDDGKLLLGPKPHVSIQPTEPIVYTITVKELTAAGISGSGRIRVRNLDTPRLKSSISGSGNVDLSGKADRVELSVSGSGAFNAAELQARSAAVTISGSGSAVVNATDGVAAKISGSGSVEYISDYALDMSISGSGSIKRRPGPATRPAGR